MPSLMWKSNKLLETIIVYSQIKCADIPVLGCC